MVQIMESHCSKHSTANVESAHRSVATSHMPRRKREGAERCVRCHGALPCAPSTWRALRNIDAHRYAPFACGFESAYGSKPFLKISSDSSVARRAALGTPFTHTRTIIGPMGKPDSALVLLVNVVSVKASDGSLSMKRCC